jgi:hypothetical protein
VYRVTGKLWLALPAAVGAVMRLVFTWLISILEPIEGLAAFKAKQEWMFYLSLSLSTAASQTLYEYLRQPLIHITLPGRHLGDILAILSSVE